MAAFNRNSRPDSDRNTWPLSPKYAVGGSAILFGFSTLFIGPVFFTLKVANKIALDRSDAGFALNIVFSVLAMICVYTIIRNYCFQSPGISQGKFVTAEFFGCGAAISFIPIIGIILIGLIFDLTFGYKVSPFALANKNKKAKG